MAIRIKKVSEGRYTAQLILPDMPAVKSAWETNEPMGVDQLIQELESRGAHQTDIGDAFYAADPNWLSQ